jgi:hypothetical protein
MTKLDEHFFSIGACSEGRKWVSEHCATAAECWEKLLSEGHIDWAVWWLTRGRDWISVRPLALRWALRGARVHAATICDAYGMTIRAGALRALPDDSGFSTICDAALAALASLDALAYRDVLDYRDVRDVRDVLDALAGLAARAYRDALDVRAALAYRDAEKRLQIADIRELVSCPWTEPTT